MKALSISVPKAIGALILLFYGAYCAIRPAEWHLIDGVNLVAHEAGHMLFGWFGEFPGIAGGTIGQLFVPAACAIYFYLQDARYSATVPFFWLGQSMINVSVYVKDARTMELPLVSIGAGGDPIHDWHWMLARLGLLERDQMVGNIFLGTGVLIMLAAAIGALLLSLNRPDEADGLTG